MRAAPVFDSTVSVSPSGSVRSLLNSLHDSLFGALAELMFGRERLDLAGRYDDQESAIEREVFGDMQACGCRCCGMHLPRLLRADAYDHQERRDGWEETLTRVLTASGLVRGVSSRVEDGRLAHVRGGRVSVVRS